MPVLLFFNELSCTTRASQEDVGAAMSEFVALLRKVREWRRDLALVSVAHLTSLELSQGYYLRQWIAEPANRDRWRFIRGLQNRAPFRDVLPLGAGDNVDYQYQGSSAQGLGAAHLMDGLAVSLALASDWNVAQVELVREVLAEQDDGELLIVKESADVRHAASLLHLVTHEERVKATGLADLAGGQDLWDRREDFFGHLRFLPRVEGDLRGLPADWLKPVAEELLRLEEAISAWRPAQSRFPTWQTKITPEGETRKRICVFTDLDGVERVFDLHARFTPRAGRLHFRLDPASSTAVVAYIGLKMKR